MLMDLNTRGITKTTNEKVGEPMYGQMEENTRANGMKACRTELAKSMKQDEQKKDMVSMLTMKIRNG